MLCVACVVCDVLYVVSFGIVCCLLLVVCGFVCVAFYVFTVCWCLVFGVWYYAF